MTFTLVPTRQALMPVACSLAHLQQASIAMACTATSDKPILAPRRISVPAPRTRPVPAPCTKLLLSPVVNLRPVPASCTKFLPASIVDFQQVPAPCTRLVPVPHTRLLPSPTGNPMSALEPVHEPDTEPVPAPQASSRVRSQARA